MSGSRGPTAFGLAPGFEYGVGAGDAVARTDSNAAGKSKLRIVRSAILS